MNGLDDASFQGLNDWMLVMNILKILSTHKLKKKQEISGDLQNGITMGSRTINIRKIEMQNFFLCESRNSGKYRELLI